MGFEEEIKKHIATINDEMGSVKKEMGNIKEKMAKIETDLDWLKRFFWIVAVSSIGALITELISLLSKK
jgi:archaellum component FlaC